MTAEEVLARIKKTPTIGLKRARIFYDFITANNLQTGLAVGLSRFGSIASIAGALQDLDFGSLIAMDVISAHNLKPALDETLQRLGLASLVQVYYEPRSVNWRLMKLLEASRYESYDFCYLNGIPTWYEAGLAFCLIERLLKPGGWVVFEELHFTYRDSRLRERIRVEQMTEEEQACPQVERVFELLVEANPHFCSFRRLNQLAFAQKRYPVWSIEQRTQNYEDILLSRALLRAHTDPEFRDILLSLPAQAIAEIDSKPNQNLKHLNFVETQYFAPLAPKISPSGEMTIYLERPSWDCAITETILQKMLED